MPAKERWLSLSIFDKASQERRAPRKSLIVSIPKKSARLATRRNRLKRLIREAVRGDDFFKEADKRYRFRVEGSPPPGLTLRDVQAFLKTLKEETGIVE